MPNRYCNTFDNSNPTMVTKEQIEETLRDFEEIDKKWEESHPMNVKVDFQTYEEIIAYYNAELLDDFIKRFREGR